MNTIEIDLGKVDNSCFVIMPFSTLFQVEYKKIIQPALTELNIECVRGDEIYAKQRIVDDIWNSLKKCRFVIAELTGKNPNVLYEIGLAHAIGKPVIIITRNEDDVPFDLKALRYLYYDVNDPFWGENLKVGIQNLVQKVLENPEIEIYLNSIKKSSIEYPEIIHKKVETTPIKIKAIEFSGTWQGEFKNSDDILHKVTLQLTQENDYYSGATVISFTKDEIQTVVHQMMSVNINKDTINLHGINYTYIERGASKRYSLDDFKLKFDKIHNQLIGDVISTDELGGTHASTEIVLLKI